MLRLECAGCEDWRTVGRFCSRIASRMPCVHGEVRYVGPAPDSSDVKWTKAGDTQVAGDHYKKMGVEPWDVVDTWPIEQRIGAYRHGALKYLMRMGSKDQNAQEIAKGKHYMEKLLEVLNDA